MKTGDQDTIKHNRSGFIFHFSLFYCFLFVSCWLLILLVGLLVDFFFDLIVVSYWVFVGCWLVVDCPNGR